MEILPTTYLPLTSPPSINTYYLFLAPKQDGDYLPTTSTQDGGAFTTSDDPFNIHHSLLARTQDRQLSLPTTAL